jgi:hypothetical protein
MRSTAIVFTLVLGAAVAGPSGAAHERRPVEELFQSYVRGDFAAVEHGLQREPFTQGGRPLFEEVDRLIARWQGERRRTVAAFLLEIADAAFIRRSESAALDLLTRARQAVTSRPDPPGRDADQDAFEILFHQTAVALMAGRLSAEGLEREALRPLRQLIVAEPQGRGGPMLVAPWIALAEALAQERRAYEDAASLRRLAANALESLERAANYAENRAEATVRKAWLLIRLGRPTDALNVLEAFGDPAAVESRTIRYWALLFRGGVQGSPRAHPHGAVADRGAGRARDEPRPPGVRRRLGGQRSCRFSGD